MTSLYWIVLGVHFCVLWFVQKFMWRSIDHLYTVSSEDTREGFRFPFGALGKTGNLQKFMWSCIYLLYIISLEDTLSKEFRFLFGALGMIDNLQKCMWPHIYHLYTISSEDTLSKEFRFPFGALGKAGNPWAPALVISRTRASVSRVSEIQFRLIFIIIL